MATFGAWGNTDPKSIPKKAPKVLGLKRTAESAPRKPTDLEMEKTPGTPQHRATRPFPLDEWVPLKDRGAEKPYQHPGWKTPGEMEKGRGITEKEAFASALRDLMVRYSRGVGGARRDRIQTLKPKTSKPVPMPDVKTGKDALWSLEWELRKRAFEGDPNAWKT